MILERSVIDLPGPFAAARIFGFLRDRAIDGVEHVTHTGGVWRYARTVGLPGGPGAIAVEHRDGALRVDVEASTAGDVAAGLAIAGRIFDVDAPMREIDEALARCGDIPVLEQPGIRLPGAHDLHEILIRAIVGQQITVARAREHLIRLARAHGQRYESAHPEWFGDLPGLFPTPERLAAHLPVPGPTETLDPRRVLRLPRRSIAAVVEASRACAAAQASVASLTDLPGVGLWTAAYVRMRLLPDRDAWLYGDVALVAGAKRLGLIPQDLPARTAHRELASISERWRPWRSYAALRLWASAAD